MRTRLWATQDHKNGSYSAVVCLKRAGLATVAVAVNGDPAGPPTTLPVQPGELRALVLVSRGHLCTTAGAARDMRETPVYSWTGSNYSSNDSPQSDNSPWRRSGVCSLQCKT